jgi:hypothetical protein
MEIVKSSKRDLFTYDYYCQIIETLKLRKFSFCHFVDEQAEGSLKVYLRHDIDLNLADALELAKLESKLGVNSSYFFMLEAEIYNIFAPTNRQKISEIIALGHDVGLHFVPGIDMSPLELEVQVNREAEILGNLLQYKIKCFSIHRPAPYILSSDFRPRGLINTYSPEYFSKEKYISDSNHNFRCGNPIEFIERFQGNDLQILTHPVWWKQKSMLPKDKIYKVVEDCNLITKNYLRENIKLAETIL